MQSHIDNEDDVLSPESIETEGQDVRGTVFVIPLAAPIPNELAEVKMAEGTLYERIAPLATALESEFAFMPLTGSEMLALERAWRQLQVVKKIAVLTELPGAKYDIIFDQAVRQLGLRKLDWPQVSEAIARRVRTVQRTKDTTPWVLGNPKAEAGQTRKSFSNSNIADVDRAMPTPPTGENDDDENP